VAIEHLRHHEGRPVAHWACAELAVLHSKRRSLAPERRARARLSRIASIGRAAIRRLQRGRDLVGAWHRWSARARTAGLDPISARSADEKIARLGRAIRMLRRLGLLAG